MRYWRVFAVALVAMALVVGVSAALAGEGSEPKKPDIVDTAVKAGNFTTLVDAIKKADLVETLKGKGPFTVFAPTDAAWEKMPEERRARMLNPEGEAGKERLSELLLNHVAKGKFMAADVVKMETVGTQAGYDVTIKTEDDKVMYGNAVITKTDIECGNGVIHVIDAVVPPGARAGAATPAK